MNVWNRIIILSGSEMIVYNARIFNMYYVYLGMYAVRKLIVMGIDKIFCEYEQMAICLLDNLWAGHNGTFDNFQALEFRANIPMFFLDF